MLGPHRLPAVRICLPIVSLLLWGVAAVAGATALAEDGYSSQRIVSSDSHSTTVILRGAKRETRGNRGKSSPSRRSRCVAAARGGKHRKAGRSCVVKKKSKTRALRPGASGTRAGSSSSNPPPVAFPGVQAPVSGGVAPADISQPTGPEAGSPPESPGGGSPPGGSTGSSEPAGGSEPVAPVEPAAPFRFFASTSFWNESLGGGVSLDPGSVAVMGAFDEEIAVEERAGNGPWINTTSYSIPVYTVPAGQPTVPVRLDGSVNAALSAAWSAVPLPSTAVPAVGHDGSLVLWQPSRDRLWEFHKLLREGGVWKANWGGAMQDVSSNPGVYGSGAWPGAQSWWGISASSLSLVGGLISLEDLEKGVINHALAMAIPAVRAGVYASPAQRSDGKTGGSLSLPEGAHLRLNPNLDLAALHLPRLTLMIAKAAQRYGIFVTDGSSDIEIYAQDPTPTGTNPYTGPNGYFEGQHPDQLLASFPWKELELLKMELHVAKHTS